MGIEEKFNKIESQVLDVNNKNYFSKYLEEARNLIDDIGYFNSHVKRTSTSKRFGYEIIPSLGSVIMDFFIKDIFYEDNSWRYDEDEVIEKLKIYDITKKIFENINKDDKKTGWVIDKKWIKVGIKWSEVLEFYTGKKMKDVIHNFNGSNYGIEKIREAWEEIEKLTPSAGGGKR